MKNLASSVDRKKVRGNAVLIIDSDEMNIDMSKALLEKRLKCRVLTANNGVQGLEILRTRQVQLVLLELEMPYFNGFQVLQTMRLEDALKDVPVLIFTKAANEKNILRAAQYGIIGYIKKPFVPDELINRVAKYVPEGETYKLLVVDDNDRDLERAANIMSERFPHEILAVSSGIEGLELLRNEEIQLVVSATDMPLIDGLRLLTFVREDKRLKNTPVIFMDYEEDPDFTDEAEELGFQGFVAKPVRAQELISAIEAALPT